MADNSDETGSNEPANAEPGDFPEEAIFTRDAEAITQNPETENMEVHHHPEMEKKGLKEYLLEGFMIFVAVSMGFVAENIREHFTEKRIEKEYIASFVADMMQDTVNFNRIIPREEQSIKGIDTMLHILGEKSFSDSNNRMLYYLFRRYCMSIEAMRYTQRTITQLKNSGGLRLISGKQASDSIIAYNKIADDNIDLVNVTTHDFMIPSIHLGNKIFNTAYLLPYDNGNAAIGILSLHSAMPLLTNNTPVIQEYMGLVYEVKEIRTSYVQQLQWHLQSAKNMIAFFKQAYPAEND